MVSIALSSCHPTRHSIFWLTSPRKFHCAMKTCLLICTAAAISPVLVGKRPLACFLMRAVVAISPVLVGKRPLACFVMRAFVAISTQYLVANVPLQVSLGNVHLLVDSYCCGNLPSSCWQTSPWMHFANVQLLADSHCCIWQSTSPCWLANVPLQLACQSAIVC